MAWINDVFRSRTVYKIGSFLSYYFKLASTGMFVGFLTLLLWESLPNSSVVGFLKDLDKSFIQQYMNLIESEEVLILNVLLISFIAVVAVIVSKGYQFFLKTSAVFIGVSLWLLFNNNNFWSSPLVADTWVNPKSLLTILFNLGLMFVLFDFSKLIIGAVFNWVGSFLVNLEIKSKIFEYQFVFSVPKVFDRIKVEILKRRKKKNPNPSFSDEPLKDLNAIELIRTSCGNNSLFSTFLQKLTVVKDLIHREDDEKNYTRSICLDGPWGSGKTSLVNILREEVSNFSSGKITWINFDPWNFSNSSEFISDFFDTLNKVLICKYRVDLQPNLKLYVDLVTPIIESVGVFGSLKSTLLELPFFAPKNLSSLKKGISKQLARIPEKVVVVLDDIDRLKLEEIEIVLQLVRQLSNFPNMLFILPFDYARISNLIIKQKGDAYSDFLGKIVNSRIKLKTYSYSELEAIFICSITLTPSPEVQKVLEKTFDIFVREKTDPKFEEIRKREDEANKNEKANPALKPMVSFARDVFQILYPNGHYMGKYIESVAAMNKTIDLYLGDFYIDTKSFVEGIVENFSSIKKEELVSEFGALRQSIDIEVRTLSPNQQQLDDLDSLWTSFITTLKNNQSYSSIDKEWQGFKNYGIVNQLIQSNGGTTASISQIEASLNTFRSDFVEWSVNHNNIKDWLVESITPRQTKDLARAITDEGDVDENVKLDGFVEEIAIRVAGMQ